MKPLGWKLCLGFALLGPSAGGQDTGLLLGIEVRQEDEGFWQPVPQALQTYWIVGDRHGARVEAVVSGLLVPQQRGFLRVGIARRCRRDAEIGSECSDQYWAAPVSAPPPGPPLAHAPATAPPEDETPCVYETLRIQFVSPKGVALWRNQGNSETCEPRGYHWFTDAWVQPVSGEGHIRLTEITRNAAAAYARAAREAESEAAKDLDVPCEMDSAADDRWTIVREAGAWRPRLVQQDGLGYCDLAAPIAVDFPQAFTGPAGLAIPWIKLLASIPDLTDAVSSPARSWTVGTTGSGLLLIRKGAKVKLISAVTRPRVVMAQWALGRHVREWSDVIKAIP